MVYLFLVWVRIDGKDAINNRVGSWDEPLEWLAPAYLKSDVLLFVRKSIRDTLNLLEQSLKVA